MPRRYLVVVATFFLSFLLYVDRVCIATAKDPIMADLSLSEKQFGWILSIFALGYALFQTPSGMAADKFGPRKLLASIVAIWSLFTGLTAYAWNFVSMLVVRFLFGVGEAGAFPGMSRAVFSWIPMKERGLVKGINLSASRLGAAATMPLLPFMIAAIGWKMSFIVLMLIGFAWAAIWWFWFRDEPQDHPTITDEEKAYIAANVQDSDAPDKPVGKLPIGHMLKSRNLWLLMIQYGASNYTAYFCLSWLFAYIKTTYDLSFTSAGFYAMIPLLAGGLGCVASGAAVDAIYRAGKINLSRRLPAIAGFALAALGLLMSVGQEGVWGAVFWLSLAVFGVDMILSPSWSFCIDIGGRHAGQVSGTMNMAGNIASAGTALAFPYLQAWTGTTNTFFYLGAGLAAVAMISWVMVDPTKKIEEVPA